MFAKLIIAVYVILLDGCVLDGPVHTLALAVDQSMFRLGRAMINVAFSAGQNKTVRTEQRLCLNQFIDQSCYPTVALGIYEMGPVVGQYDVDLVMNSVDYAKEKVAGGTPDDPRMQFGESKLVSSNNGEESLSYSVQPLVISM